MTLYLLDTNIVSLFQRGHAVVCTAVNQHASQEIAITVMTIEEQLTGWYSELRRVKKLGMLAAVYQRMADTVKFYAGLPIYSLTDPAIQRYEDLKRRKLKIGKTDLRIAAIALEYKAVLVTRNSSDFLQVPGMRIEDWSK